ncbi:hypothetical protein CF326_g9754 [Tilletia indica]|nr:hypothetical protein CF326_g9754 [Tilletia indica]
MSASIGFETLPRTVPSGVLSDSVKSELSRCLFFRGGVIVLLLAAEPLLSALSPISFSACSSASRIGAVRFCGASSEGSIDTALASGSTPIFQMFQKKTSCPDNPSTQAQAPPHPHSKSYSS